MMNKKFPFQEMAEIVEEASPQASIRTRRDVLLRGGRMIKWKGILVCLAPVRGTMLVMGALMIAGMGTACALTDASGPDTINVASGNYAGGISYVDSDGLTLVLNDSGITVGTGLTGVNITSNLANTNAIVINAANFGTITTTGTDTDLGYGLYVHNQGTAGDAAISIGGGSIMTNGYLAAGAHVRNSGSGSALVSFANGAIATVGSSAHGIQSLINNEGSTAISEARMSSGSISTTGTWARGIYAQNYGRGESLVTLDGGSISTQGGAAHGINAEVDTTDAANNAPATVRMNGGSIVTTGEASAGIKSESYDAGDVRAFVTGGTISASGLNAHGIWVISNDAEADTPTGNARVEVNASVTGGTGAAGAANSAYAIYTQTATDHMSTIIAKDQAVLSAASGNAIYNNHGDSLTEIHAGADVTGRIDLHQGDDTLNILGADLSNITVMDGGDDTSVADGFIDRLVIDGVTADKNGANMINWEVAELKNSNLTISDGSWKVGQLDDATTGVFLSDGSTLDGGMALDLDANLAIDDSSRFVGTGGGSGVYNIAGSVANQGLITTVDGAVGDVVNIAGDYSGNGRFEADVDFFTDKADQLVIGGNVTSGTTVIRLNDVSSGTPTGNNVLLLTVNGTSNDSNFAFNPIATSDGVRTYNLERQGNQWILNSELNAGVFNGFAPQVPMEEVYPRVLLDSIGGTGSNAGGLPTMQQRIGNRYWTQSPTVTAPESSKSGMASDSSKSGMPYSSKDASVKHADFDAGGSQSGWIDNQGVWARMEGSHSSVSPVGSTAGVTGYDVDQFRMQAGADFLLKQNQDGSRLFGGLNLHYGTTRAGVDSTGGTGLIETDGYGAGASMTWLNMDGVYVDMQGLATWFNSDLSSSELGSIVRDNDGFGYAFSVEAGKRIGLDHGWTTTPQVQLSYAAADFDRFKGALDESVSCGHAESLRLRLGITADRDWAWTGRNGKQQRAHFYGIANVIHEFQPTTKVLAETSTLRHERDTWTGEIGIGGTRNFDDDRYSLYGELTTGTGLADFGDSYRVSGTVGVRMAF